MKLNDELVFERREFSAGEENKLLHRRCKKYPRETKSAILGVEREN